MKTKEKQDISLDIAIGFFQSGELGNAQKTLIKIIKKKRPPALAWFIHAIIFTQQNQFSQAVPAFRKAISIQPLYPDAHNNLGVVFERQKNNDEAIKHYKIAIKQRPDYANALFNLANIEHNIGNLETAQKYYLKAIQSNPQYLKALNNLGLLYQQQNKLELATQYFNKAISISPDDFEVLNNMGHTHHLNEEYDKALIFYHKALALSPNNPEILNNIGITLQSQQHFVTAEQHFKHAIDLQPNYYQAITNLANLYKENDQYTLAKKHYQFALDINPNAPATNNNYGLILFHEGKYADAEEHFNAAIQTDQHYTEARYNLAAIQLSSGIFKQGWENYHYRTQPRHPLAENTTNMNIADIKGKHILLLNEQGIGDELFFLRFAPKLRELARSITYLATPKTQTLATQLSSLNKTVNNISDAGNYDLAISIGDLPQLLTDRGDETANSIQLFTSDDHVEEMKKLLSSFGPPPYIGVTWRAGLNEKNRLFKTIPLNQLLTSLENVNATFISLQRKPTQNELDILKQHPTFSTMPNLDIYNEDLPKMLALLGLLNEYIGVSNTNMHLMASIQKPARVLVPNPPEWRWMLSGEASPWFPDFRIYRQATNNDWQPALTTLSQDLVNINA